MDLSVVEAAAAAELNAITRPLKKLTDAERDQLRREGKCFRCRQVGHISSQCPKNPSKNGMSQRDP